jgi:glycosyltransferase involved in cell wall biosynthesis
MMSDTVTVAIGTTVYQDCPGVKRMLSSVYKQVDRVIFVDGRFPGFDSCCMPGISTDGLKEYLQEFDNIHLVEMANEPQVAKRNKYLEIAAEYKIDIVLVLDADEWIEERKEYGGWEDFRKRAADIIHSPHDGFDFIYNLYGIWEQYGAPDQLQHNPRIIFRPEQCEYYGHHNWLRNKSRGYRLWMEPPVSRGIVLRGDNTLRSEYREHQMDRYERFQQVCDEKYT